MPESCFQFQKTALRAGHGSNISVRCPKDCVREPVLDYGRSVMRTLFVQVGVSNCGLVVISHIDCRREFVLFHQ